TIRADLSELPDIPNRYNVLDRPPDRRPPPHDSGRKFKYRQRYAVKTRSHQIMHEPPESMKQYKLKPWKKPPDPPIDASPDNPQPNQKPKKKLPSKKFPPSAAAIFLPKVKISLQRVTRLSAQIKRTCQRAIGSYIERLSLDYIEEDDIAEGTTVEGTTVEGTTVEGTTVGSSTGNIKQSLEKIPEIDRLILEKLCPAFSEKDLAAFGNGVEQEPVNSEVVDEHDDSNDNKNEPLLFLLSLSNMSLPPMTKNRTPLEYAGSAFLRSAAVQLSVELRRHYKNGSIELCKKSLWESKVIGPSVVFDDKFVTLSELDLTKIFWPDPDLRLQLQ
ncbi:hypothetical protein BGX30_007463, partial [Mortierella sp. GBA39]